MRAEVYYYLVYFGAQHFPIFDQNNKKESSNSASLHFCEQNPPVTGDFTSQRTSNV